VKEDKVYCLFGIFDVFMPLIYGEGEDHAYYRLIGAIERSLKWKTTDGGQPTPESAGTFGLEVIHSLHTAFTTGT
jgi:hypothetical protein